MMVSRKRRGCLQFSLRTILLAMTLASIGCGLLFGAPILLGFLLLFFLFTAIPLALTITIVYGRGYLRTFAIGAMFPGSLAVFYSYALLASGLADLEDDDLETRMTLAAYLVGLHLVIALYGGTAMFVRWGIERWQTKREEPERTVPLPESPFDVESAPE